VTLPKPVPASAKDVRLETGLTYIQRNCHRESAAGVKYIDRNYIDYRSGGKFLYVGNLHKSTTDADLMLIFGPHKAEKAEVKRFKWSGESRGFGFVTFPCVPSCSLAKQDIGTVELHGNVLNIQLSDPSVNRATIEDIKKWKH
jgi:RNA recognition motif. (a.k.a. RRM, RBD, or RNP domain)